MPGRSTVESAPSSKIALRARRRVSLVVRPLRFSTSRSRSRPVGLDLVARIGLHPLARNFLHQCAALVPIRHCELATRTELFQLVGQGNLIAQQYHRARDLLISDTDVLQQAHVNRLGQVGMKIYEYVHARRGGGANVPQDLDRLRVMTLWRTEIDIDALEAIGHGPLEHRCMRVTRQPHGQ